MADLEPVFLTTDASITKKLERARDELLDLSARNRLLNMPRQSRTARSIEVVDERATEIYRLLVRECKSFTFLPGRAQKGSADEEDSEEIDELSQPDDDSRDERGVLNRHADTKLQTRLTPAGLQKRLLELYLDARTLEDEQGVNILYVALGSLRWVDPHNKELVRHAPLLLVPVSLERASAKERFRLKWRQEDCSANLSLEMFLDRVHLLKLPAFLPIDEFDYTAYVTGVADVVAMKEGWSVQPDDIVLGFFSYAKFLMYRDLDSANWPGDGKLIDAGLIRALLQDGFPERRERISDEAHLDEVIRPADMRHIHDSDSSQVLAAYEARAGETLVIQGPPGTGKSQTIANIIGEAVADGRKVLFVSEKMAALEVVKRRLDQAGVGDACLELHSNKANKKTVLDELRRTWELGAPKGAAADTADVALENSRNLLNRHVFRMHRALRASGLTPYEVIGRLSGMQRLNGAEGDLRLDGAEDWNAEERNERFRLLREITRWVVAEGRPSDHVWWCVTLESILSPQAERLSRTAAELASALKEILEEQVQLAQDLDMDEPEKFQDFAFIALRAQRVSTAPPSVGASLAAAEWECKEDVRHLLEAGTRFAELSSTLRDRVSTSGWQLNTDSAHLTLASLPGQFNGEWLARAERLHRLIPQLIAGANTVSNCIGMAANNANAAAIRRTLETARHVAAAPPAAPETFTAAVWDHGVERASDLVGAVASLEAARQQIGDRVADAAWETDCGALRQTLAAHGTGLLRWLSPEWRRADRTVKSFLRNPATPLSDAVKLLDELAKGQRARILIRQGDEFGAAAFGPQWRGERSSSAPLRAVSEWARELGPRSHQIRGMVARVSDLTQVRVDVSCLEAIWTEFAALLEEVAVGLGYESAAVAEQVSLDDLKHRMESLVAAQKICHQAFVSVPDLVSERVRLLEALSSRRVDERVLTQGDELGRRCFGQLWNCADSDWNVLRTAAQWVTTNADIRHVAAKFGKPSDALARSERATVRLEEAVGAIEQLFRDLQFDGGRLFGTCEIRDIRSTELRSRLERWAAAQEALSKWTEYSRRAKRARLQGLGEVVDRLESGKLGPAEALIETERAYYWAVLVSVANEDPELARFDGSAHQGHVDEFVRLEGEHRQAARVAAMRSHYQRIPHGGAGPVGVLKAEIARRRGHMPIRQLMSHAGPAIQALKPIMMMSPLSVAQFLPPGELKFDLLVMDEASQIQPVDALGAIARCRQAVVVGDERQLPPTRFFARMTGGQSDDDDAETTQVADVESILGLFLGRGAQQRTLRWHYRSEHHSLIAVSNREFYENKLWILPSPYTHEAGRGVRFNQVTGGVYDSGNTRTNAVEARQVACAVIDHARRHPGQTLGVGTFSVAQRRAIQDQVELLRRSEPDTESFFSAHPHEPFFVKNLENIQGDERDVIFISVGYGRNAAGQMSMRFGPLSNQGGERRLNVLITRAKRRCEIFTSITDQDIDLERAPGRGVAAFQLFLRFARTGQMDVSGAEPREDATRVMEEDIASALRGRGYEVDTHVGVTGAFVDIAVLDSEHRERYVLGIECDGLSYSSARSARDRDRLRRQALERQGWRLQRVWSMDWYQRPTEQLDRIIAAIEAEKRRLQVEADEASDVSLGIAIERDETADAFAKTQSDVVTYVEAVPSRPVPGTDLLDTPVQAIALMVAEIVDVEGPIHQDEVIVRVRSAWGLQRAGTRIQEHVTKAIRAARILRGIEREGKFLNMPGRPPRLRNRSGVVSRSLRQPEMLAPAEIRAGVADIVRENFGAREEEIINAVLRRLGYATSSANLRDVVESAVQKMRATGVLAGHGDLLMMVDAGTK